jgi:mRNA interferase MazF
MCDNSLFGELFGSQGRAGRVVCCLFPHIESQVGEGSRHVLFKKGEANLPKDSVVNVTQIVTVDKSVLSEKIGTLDRSRVEQIVQGLRLLIESRTVG